MHRTIQYIILFVAVLLLQLLFINNLDLGVYVHPLICLAFVALLPVELASIWVLLSSFAMGVLLDFGSGTAGLSSAAMMLSGFTRPLLLRVALGKDNMREGSGTPTSAMVGQWGFIRYALVFSLIYCLFYFSLEAATLSYFYLTAIRIAISTVASAALIYICQLFFIDR